MSDWVIEAKGVAKRYREGGLDVSVLAEVSLSVAAGEAVAVVGASGSGKSTLLHLLGGLDLPTTGSVILGGRDWASMGASEQGRWRNTHVGFIYQFHHLLGELSAEENVAVPLRLRGASAALAQAQAAEALRGVGLGERLAHRPSELSGGERQRVAVARALVGQPRCVLADEPTGNLDRATAEHVFGLMMGLTRERGSALVLVTHDSALAARCDRVLNLVSGRIA
jgi:lipoprotein-releasing system ATP-binding protein